MRKIYKRIKGAVRAEICGAFPEAVLNACAVNAVLLWDLDCVNEYTVQLSLYEKQLGELRALAEKSMCQLSVLSLSGGSRDRKLIKGRLWLLISALLVAGLLAASSLFIWEIEVRGCEKVSRAQVLRALSDCGVEQGSFWPSLSADLVRSRMLTELPELAWMTVNVSGSRAIVLVAERQEKPEIYIESEAGDIIAGKTGIISRLSVLNGRALVSPGQAVLKGETLVSGAMDSITNPPRFVRAQAQVIADTWYELTAVCPTESQIKTEEKSSWSRFAIKLGKKRINFYFGSGKDIDECDKIIHEYKLGLEGLFALPVTIVREQLIRWELETAESVAEQEMRDRLYAYLQQSIDGEIISSSFSASRSDGLLHVTLRAQCREDIARNIDTSQAEDAPTLPTVKGNSQ